MSYHHIQNIHNKFCYKGSGGSKGGAAGTRPPYGSRFFRFDIQIFLNIAASGVGAPPTRSAPPLQEILDLLLKGALIFPQFCQFNLLQITLRWQILVAVVVLLCVCVCVCMYVCACVCVRVFLFHFTAILLGNKFSNHFSYI